MIPPQRQFLEQNARWRPDETAVRFADTGDALTYGEFDARANRAANALHDRGVRFGDRVGLVLFNTHEFPVVLYACHKLGAVPVAVNTQLSVDEFRYVFDHMGAKVLVYDHEIAEAVEAAEADTTRDHDLIGGGFEPADGTVFTDFLDEGSDDPPAEISVDKDDISYMFYTSGTTGRPKGVMHTVKSGRERANVSIMECGVTSDSVSLALLPWYHGAGIDITVRATVAAGAEIIVLKRPDIGQALDAIEAHDVSHIMSVPTLTERFVDHETIDDRDLSKVQYWLHTGEVLTQDQARTFMEELTPNVYNLYGSSEGGVDTALTPADLPEHAGTVGKPCNGVEIRVVEGASEGLPDPDATVDQGSTGEVVVKTDQLFRGYFEDEPKTRQTVRDGWLYMGDVGFVTEDGYLKVTGRADDMIVSGGELISPVDVERALEAHEDVTGAVAVGVDDPEWGQRVKVVVAGEDLNAKSLDSYLKDGDHLADYKRPKEYQFVDEIARTGAGKKERSRYRST
jgi:long-chain acyl-CoA synthetase